MFNFKSRILFFRNLLFAPKLRYVPQAGPYNPHSLERWGSKIKILSCLFLGRKRFFAFIVGSSMIDPNFNFVPNCLMTLTALTSLAYLMVGIGRALNPAYMEFYHFFERSTKENKETVKTTLNAYGVDFTYFPVDYEARQAPLSIESKSNLSDSYVCYLYNIISEPLSYILARYLAIYLIYPGVPCSYLFANDLQIGRTSLIEDHGAKRVKIKTLLGNNIDVIYIDNRGKTSNGHQLVVVCEGNCGFYERGCLATAVEGGFSVIGWNHPGFGGSEGLPFPGQERDAINGVMEYATSSMGLGFVHPSILIYGWSIGGFTASWAAATYPGVKGLILDATFDTILPLAEDRMPMILKPLVRLIIHRQMNLDVYDHVRRYSGPILFVRRTEDELICTGDINLMSNRGTFLVRKYLRHTLPGLLDKERMDLLDEWLAADEIKKATLFDKFHIDKNGWNTRLKSIIKEADGRLPIDIGKDLGADDKNALTLYLASKYVKDFKSNHCVILPASVLDELWRPGVSS